MKCRGNSSNDHKHTTHVMTLRQTQMWTTSKNARPISKIFFYKYLISHIAWKMFTYCSDVGYLNLNLHVTYKN